MPSTAVRRRRLAAATATALAVTLGSGLLAAPAAAAGGAAVADAPPAATVPSAGSGEEIPAQVPTGTIDLDRTSALDFVFDLDAGEVLVRFTLRNARTGDSVTFLRTHGGQGGTGTGTPCRFTWDGTFSYPDPDGTAATFAANSGTYTWTLTATPAQGGDPVLTRSGSFTGTRTPRAHGFDDDGVFDLLAVGADARLHGEGSYRGGVGRSDFWSGRGWDAFDRLEVTGDVAGSAHSDFVVRDRTGVLWLYRGNGGSTPEYLEPRSRVGGGWQVYHHIAGGSDLVGDGRSDVVAADTSGVLWLYKSTGDTAAPFAARKRVGGGWQIYNQITAVGNIAGGPAGDLVARDKAGVLWLYLGKGDGTFTTRERLGGGFQRYSELVGGGDWDGDGLGDLLAVEPATRTVHAFNGTGLRFTPLDLTRKATPLFKGDAHTLYG
ncbi:hypothetical protein [Streptomyces genisteinicus]|uniref:VCBS repeat-containing protein n=1 Tax=Streptomyces genisteinicus TaxID=2768068 RepID=A0A7H0HMB8_9ACTN|nr:hypothetical protein [Streptomyces genisteinicus]QNP61684.1 hypothetical protein IAG43_01255 [Streptomyces genisteinicus]